MLCVLSFVNSIDYFRRQEDFSFRSGRVPSNELLIHTWLDATLGEIATLVKQGATNAHPRARLSFSFVYPDGRGDCVIRKVGLVSRGYRDDSDRTLHELRFQIGDYIDVGIMV